MRVSGEHHAVWLGILAPQPPAAFWTCTVLAVQISDYISPCQAGGVLGKLVVFGKVAVVIRNRDHNPPHFHVIGPDFEVQVGINPLVILRGSMTRAVWEQVAAWAAENRALLVAEWNSINPRYPM